MVVVEAAIIGGAFLAGAAGIQHFYDRYHPRGLYLRTVRRGDEVQAELSGVREALVRLPAEVGVAVGAALESAQAKFGEEMAKQLPQPVQELVPDVQKLASALGGTQKGLNALTRDAKRALGQSIVGPYMGVLRTFASPLADFLEENPEMAMEIMEWPVVKKLIGKASQMMASATGQQTTAFETGTWGT